MAARHFKLGAPLRQAGSVPSDRGEVLGLPCRNSGHLTLKISRGAVELRQTAVDVGDGQAFRQNGAAPGVDLGAGA